MFKRSHQRRRRIAATAAPRHRARAHHRIIQDAEATNAGLRAYMKRRKRASIVYLDPPWSMGRTTVGLAAGSVSPELHYPTKRTVKLELFARERARGWKAWGNQAPKKVGGQRRALRKAA